ncbi:MAG TPA: hypothetical protein ENO17_07685 [Candidatus Atribacteria bacterium]|nr:hypothetical protein [Candidatus Atribacteria bacterium]
MIISKKSIFHTVLLISLTITTLVYGASSCLTTEDATTYCQEITIDQPIEEVNTLVIPENNNMICDSLTGTCGPPSGWY